MISSDFRNDIAKQKAHVTRLISHTYESLLGLCTGLMADGKLSGNEILFLDQWLSKHSELLDTWPGNILHHRIKEVLADGIITPEERKYLETTLYDLIRGTLQNTAAADDPSTQLPVNEIESLTFDGSSFCFTGTFMFGTMSACQRAVEKRGGIPRKSVTRNLDYLVIGTKSTPSRVNTPFKRKIEKAVEYQKKGLPLLIVDEEQWARYL